MGDKALVQGFRLSKEIWPKFCEQWLDTQFMDGIRKRDNITYFLWLAAEHPGKRDPEKHQVGAECPPTERQR